jgi:RNA polymerase sigma factor (sigma-70 family)
VAGLLGGDEAALRRLMERYDRLVRFTIYRASKAECQADPQWLDSVASAAWSGFVQTLRRRPSDRPRSVGALLATVARNHVVSALRSRRPEMPELNNQEVTAELDDPLLLLTNLELLEALRACSAGLENEDQVILSQLASLLDRRWTEAATALGTSESTLRYRWGRVLQRLRDCVEGKTGRRFAPQDNRGDS